MTSCCFRTVSQLTTKYLFLESFNNELACKGYARFWLERNHGGGITGTWGRPVLWRIRKSGPKRVRRTAAPTLGRRRCRWVERYDTRMKVVRQSVPPGTVSCPQRDFSRGFTAVALFTWTRRLCQHMARPCWLAAWAGADARPPWSESSNGLATVQDTDRTYGVLE